MFRGLAPLSAVGVDRGALFFYDLGISLMSCHHIDFVALNLAFERDRRSAIDDPLTKQLNHRLDVVSIHVEFLGDLQTRQIQTHKVEANDPSLQGLMMTCEDGSSEIVKPFLATVAEVALAIGLSVVTAVLDNSIARAIRTNDDIRPSHVADGLEALGVVDEVLDVDHVSVL